jgi:ribonuclease HI
MPQGKLEIVYTDGGCNNGGQNRDLPSGVGACAYVRKSDGDIAVVIAQYVCNTTNNRMEMMAVINVIKATEPGTRLRIFSDSGYVVTGWNHPSYLEKWLVNGWRNSKNGPVENQDLWKELLELRKGHDFELALIKGHGRDSNAEHAKWNNIVDHACTWMMHNATVHDDHCILTYDLTKPKPSMTGVR